MPTQPAVHLDDRRTCACGTTWSGGYAFGGHVRWSPDCAEAPADIIERNVHHSDDHWLWVGAAAPSGRTGNLYGALTHRGTHWKAHRWSYTVLVGPIPEGHHIDHLCDQTLCVNPAHLEAVTEEEHDRRTRAKIERNQPDDTHPEPF